MRPSVRSIEYEEGRKVDRMPNCSKDNSNTIIEDELRSRASDVEAASDCDVLAFVGPILFGTEDAIRDATEAFGQSRERLAVVVETNGGYIEVTQRMVDTLRHHYVHVEFIVPNFALSAGTVLVMSGDGIHMDYFSILGPIDPQAKRPGSENLIPALGYLVQYERLIEKSRLGDLTTAEASFIIEKFDPAELYQYEQDRQLSITLLKEWLAKYKFKDWTVTETSQTPVTPEMREQRAEEIATALNDTDRWHSHARGISMQVLRDDLNLKINDLDDNHRLRDSVRAYYRLLKDYMGKLGHQGAVHTRNQFVPLM
jgi:hypothetical protein